MKPDAHKDNGAAVTPKRGRGRPPKARAPILTAAGMDELAKLAGMTGTRKEGAALVLVRGMSLGAAALRAGLSAKSLGNALRRGRQALERSQRLAADSENLESSPK